MEFRALIDVNGPKCSLDNVALIPGKTPPQEIVIIIRHAGTDTPLRISECVKKNQKVPRQLENS